MGERVGRPSMWWARGDRSRWAARAVAAVLGLVSAVLAVAVPFLPVNYDVTTLRWPTAEGTRSVSAPLVTQVPMWLTAHVPCETARELDARTERPGVVLATNAPDADYGKATGLSLRVDDGLLQVWSRGQQIGGGPIPPGSCSVDLRADPGGTRAELGGARLAAVGGDQRPQVTGIYSQLDARTDDVRGLDVQVRPDNRFDSTASALKVAAMVLSVLCFLGAVFALRAVEGRRPVRAAPRRWWRLDGRDVAVLGGLGVWWLIGAMTADDGYILTMLRAADDAGFVTNYFRWFGNPESPFGWFYELYALWVQVSTATPWVRLPALFLGVLSWMLISRGLLPRLGHQVKHSRSAGWAAAAAFLAFWLPYNNGLRPEPVVVALFLLAVCLVERAVATQRLTPAAWGLVVATLGLGANPHGMIAVLPFLVAIKPLVRLVRERVRESGALPVLAPALASGVLILVAVFFDQTLSTVQDAVALKTQFGPDSAWYEELTRYEKLFDKYPDGSLTRRFPVLLLMLCILGSGVVLVRRHRIRGAAHGPSRRMLMIAVLCFVALAATPTKHTHHFGVLAGIGAVLAALTAVATSAAVLRSRRNRAAFFAGLMVVCAFSVTGTNSWWYVSEWGVPWFDRAPSIDGRQASTAFLLIAFAAVVVAAVEHVRRDEPPVLTSEARRKVLRLGAAPLTLTCALCVIGEVGLFAKGIENERGSYRLGADNVEQLRGRSCGLSDYVRVEADPRRGILAPAGQQPQVSTDASVPHDYLRSRSHGFRPLGVPQDENFAPRYGYGQPGAPIWGSYDQGPSSTGEVRSQWYEVPQPEDQPAVLQFAGSSSGQNSLSVELGVQDAAGFRITERRDLVLNGGWQDVRIPVGEANRLRVVAADHRTDEDGWLAFSAPRIPVVDSMTQVVGHNRAFVEWPAALVHPCLPPMRLHNGIADLPKFRVAGGGIMRDMGQSWSDPSGGGPFGWLSVAASYRELPTYLEGEPHRDWGALYVVDPYNAGALPARAAMHVRSETRWGAWETGPLYDADPLPGPPLSSRGRSDLEPVVPADPGADT
ncbi:arabinosyltransferase domain-containing protein [Saccharopolyspora griseoalba]|uniref:Arabinosyltransferase domain-containing protein n=1 Tax=Saccharopolyspora griseoalba TaxID=1431848 RepID=A0ABW2LF91_9PSEU